MLQFIADDFERMKELGIKGTRDCSNFQEWMGKTIRRSKKSGNFDPDQARRDIIKGHATTGTIALGGHVYLVKDSASNEMVLQAIFEKEEHFHGRDINAPWQANRDFHPADSKQPLGQMGSLVGDGKGLVPLSFIEKELVSKPKPVNLKSQVDEQSMDILGQMHDPIKDDQGRLLNQMGSLTKYRWAAPDGRESEPAKFYQLSARRIDENVLRILRNKDILPTVGADTVVTEKKPQPVEKPKVETKESLVANPELSNIKETLSSLMVQFANQDKMMKDLILLFNTKESLTKPSAEVKVEEIDDIPSLPSEKEVKEEKVKHDLKHKSGKGVTLELDQEKKTTNKVVTVPNKKPSKSSEKRRRRKLKLKISPISVEAKDSTPPLPSIKMTQESLGKDPKVTPTQGPMPHQSETVSNSLLNESF